MFDHLAELSQCWAELPEGLPWCVIHGDAWVGNVVSTDDGQVILLDLERTSVGPPEWDLVHTAIKWSSFGWISREQYTEFAQVYGHDVFEWEGFGLLRDIREFRMTTMALQAASSKPSLKVQALRRLTCLMVTSTGPGQGGRLSNSSQGRQIDIADRFPAQGCVPRWRVCDCSAGVTSARRC